MWATKGNPYSEKETSRSYGDSMKWHIVNEDSIEYRGIEINQWSIRDKKIVRKKFGALACGGKFTPWIIKQKHWSTGEEYEDDIRFLIITRDTINVMQSNVCAYCRKYALKQQGKEIQVIA